MQDDDLGLNRGRDIGDVVVPVVVDPCERVAIAGRCVAIVSLAGQNNKRLILTVVVQPFNRLRLIRAVENAIINRLTEC